MGAIIMFIAIIVIALTGLAYFTYQDHKAAKRETTKK